MDQLDASLVAAYRAGDRGALEEVYYRHAPAVWRFARDMTGSEEAAADIVQETFVRAAGGLKSFRGDSALLTWLIAVSRSAARDLLRKKSRYARETPMGDREPTAPAGDPSEAAGARELAEQVRKAVASLPDHERAAVALCELQGLPLRAGAEALGWSEGQMKMTLFRARRRLRELLARYVEGVGEAMAGVPRPRTEART